MKKNIIVPVFIFLVVVLAAAVSWACAAEEVEHPEFSLLDKEGNEILEPGVEISAETTCGECHETDEINNRNKHFNDRVKVDCIRCHFKEGKITGDYTQAQLGIQLPTSQNCVSCHGITHSGSEPLAVPEDYTENLRFVRGKKYYGMTQYTGAIISHQHISDSALNMKDKSLLNTAWDVHARFGMNCLTCHNKKEGLKEPNHDLNTAACTACHNPLAIHSRLPYKERHLHVLSCQSCHVSVIYGPAFRTVDQTVVQPDNTARIELRGVDETRSHGSSLNTKYYQGYLPFLFPRKIHTDDKKDKYRISPYNLVTRWYWKSGKTGEPVPPELVRKAFFQPSASQYTADILKTFDRNRDQQIDAGELVLDSEEKIDLIKKKLSARGVEEPEIAGTVEAYRIKHGMVNASKIKWDCSVCHAGESKVGRDILLAAVSPGAPPGISPEFAKDLQPLINSHITINPNREVVLEQTASVTGHHIFGHSRIRWLRQLGLWTFFLGVFLIIGHVVFRSVLALKHPAPKLKTAPRFLYPFFDRLWHWITAVLFTLVVLTGLEIHFTGGFKLFGLASAVSIHDVLTPILVVNTALALLYHFTGARRIKQFFSFNWKTIRESLPRKGNTSRLQRLTYVVLLDLLLPFQVITGVLIWLGGYRNFAPLHNFGAWLFLTLLAIHLYLTTTGYRLFSKTRAMVTGCDEEVEDEPGLDRTTLADMKILDFAGTLIGKAEKKKLRS